MAEDQHNHESLISQLASLTGLAPQEAEPYLATNQWDLSSAAAEYYTSLEEASGQFSPEESPESETNSTPQPIPTTTKMPPPPSDSRVPPKKKFATLGDLGGDRGSSHGGHSHGSDDDEDSDSDQDLFAGGEKSGLALRNPADIKKKIIEKAKKNAPRPGGDDPVAPPSRFTGTARTLGGDDTPSQIIEDPNANKPQRLPTAKRVLHFWEDGFSVDDGPLYRSDLPENAATLRMIQQGSAPLAILKVQQGQEVDVHLEQHKGKYEKPKTKWKPFSGGGQRLGSPTPGPGSRTGDPSASPTTAAGPSHTQSAPTVEIVESEPTISLQIRLGDGTRLVSRFNTTHTIGDVYSFVSAARPSEREWVLMTTFPSKELVDRALVLGNTSEFKRGGVVVQKWKLTQILSGKGGVGKSSITTQLALSLCLAGHSVGILDVDLTGPSIPRIFGVEDAKVTQAPGGWLPVLVHPSQILPPLSTLLPHSSPSAELPNKAGAPESANYQQDNPGFFIPNGLDASASGDTKNAPHLSTFTSEPVAIGSLHVMSLGFLLPSRSSAVVWRGPKKTAMVRQFLTDVLWPPGTKYLLIDTPPGTSDEHISLAETLLSLPPLPSSILKPNPATRATSQSQQLAGAVIITTPQAVSVSDVRKELNFCKKVGVEVLGVVENMAGYVCECCGVCTNVFGKGGGEVMSEEFGVRFLGGVPVDAQWGSLVEEGKRPRYGQTGLIEEQDFMGREDGSLVDKYRSCSLCPAFRGIARGIIDKVNEL